MTVDKIVTQKEELEIVGATLLSSEEAETLPLRLRKHTNWWWLRSPGCISDLAAGVSGGSSILSYGGDVRNGTGAVRPALIIKNLKSSNLKIGDTFLFGNKKFEIISDVIAFCLEDIGQYCFKKDWKASEANDYEKSDVKKFVDNWFENSNRRMDEEVEQ